MALVPCSSTSSAVVPSSSQSPNMALPAMTTIAEFQLQAQERQQAQRGDIHMWAEALLLVALGRSQQSASYLTPSARPWEVHTAPDGRRFKQVIVDIVEDFGQICDCIPSLAAKYNIPRSSYSGVDPESLASVIWHRQNEFQQAYPHTEGIIFRIIAGATTLKVQFSWPDPSLGIC